MKSIFIFTPVLLASMMFQAPTTPPMKMGLWEENVTSKTQQPDGSEKTTSQKLRDCITESNWLRMLGPTAADACPKTNEVWSKNDYTFDVACPGKPKMASVAVHFDSTVSQHGRVQIYATPDGSPLNFQGVSEGHWIGAACGDVPTDHAVLVR